MNHELDEACLAALRVPRAEARQRAMDFSWQRAAELFESFLVPARAPVAVGGETRAWT
jgi:hypothetical protein